MKKIILLSFLVLGLIFVSCDDNNDSKNPINPDSNSLEGHWYGESTLGSDTIQFKVQIVMQASNGGLSGIGTVYASHTDYSSGTKTTQTFEMEAAVIGSIEEGSVTLRMPTNPLSNFEGQLWSDGSTISGTFTHLFTESDYEGEYVMILKRLK